MFKVNEKNRIIYPSDNPYHTNEEDGCNGAFSFKFEKSINLFVIASDGFDWEHVSVSVRNKKRCPKWNEMCFVKSNFWDDTDVVIQYHPAKKDYISFHDFCLHLWRPKNLTIPTPDALMVAPRMFKK